MSESTAPAVLAHRSEGVLVITLNRPAVRNAVNADVARGIAAALDELDGTDELRVGVLTGAGGTFCSGMDLVAFMGGEMPYVPGRGFGGIVQAPPRKPLIGAVEGWALAGGFELLLACDLVVAAETARFGVPEVTRGLVAGAGAAMLLAQRIPHAVALEMLLTGAPITARRAADLGLVNQVTPEGGALEGALALAATIAANGPLAVVVSKQIARSATDWTAAEGWARQDELTGPVFTSEDALEGATAFAEKRPPVWKGR
ncbi:MAG: crotonase/enoyl-CoA hydratase family protein [Nocardioides sp.]|nr:crotonase/enoyl-CoA hydratase family protein [Nocardioides sp.]